MSTLKKFIKRKDISVPGFEYGGKPGYYWNGKEFKKSTGSTDNGGVFSQYGGTIMKDGGSKTTPIIVNDPNDPRLRAYNDSDALYKLNPHLKKANDDWKNFIMSYPLDKNGTANYPSKSPQQDSLFSAWIKDTMTPNRQDLWAMGKEDKPKYTPYPDIPNDDYRKGKTSQIEYAKPVQPIQYQKQVREKSFIEQIPIEQRQLSTNLQQPNIQPVQGISRDDIWGKPNYKTGAPNNFSPDEYHRALGYPNIDNNGQPIKQYAEGGQAPLNWNNFNDFHAYTAQNNPNYGTDKLNHGNFANDSLMAFNKQYPDKAIHPNDISRYQQDAISNPNGVKMPYGQSSVEGIPGQRTTGYSKAEYEVRHTGANGNIISDNNYRTDVAGANRENMTLSAGRATSVPGTNPWIPNMQNVPMNASQNQIDALYQPQPVQSTQQPIAQQAPRKIPAQLGANAYLPGQNDYSVDSVREGEMKNGGMVQDSDIPEFAKGGIHIKKSHIGRFTQYKKRTGKTTEEAMRSKDPHVRAMAVFASNASHWGKKQYGGNIMADGGEIDLPDSGTNIIGNSAYQPLPDQGQQQDIEQGFNTMKSDDNLAGDPLAQQQLGNNGNPTHDYTQPGVTSDNATPYREQQQGSSPHPSWTDEAQAWGNVHNQVLGAAMTLGTAYNNHKKQNDLAAFTRDQGQSANVFAGSKLDTAGSKGDYVPNSGVFRPADSVPTRPGTFYPGDGGSSATVGTYRPRDMPFMAYGGQTPGLGLDLRWNPTQYQGAPGINPVPNPYSNPSRTLQEAEPGTENARLEKKEQVMGDFNGNGQPSLMGVNSGTHESGNDIGLTLPPESFVFSDTKSLRIKDPEILKLFGATKASTPAVLAKQYNLQKYTSTLNDPKADQTSKKTAELMVGNYQNKLSQLAALQEQMKQNKGITPPAQQGQAPTSAYGGSIPRMVVGGKGGAEINTTEQKGDDPYDEAQAKDQQYDGRYGNTTRGLQRYQIETDSKQGNDRFSKTYGKDPSGYIDGKNRVVTKRWQPPIAPIEPVSVPQFDTTLPTPNPTNLQVPAPVSGIGSLGATSPTPDTQQGAQGVQRAGFTNPDKLAMLNSAYNLASIKKYLPWEAPVSAVTPDTVFMDPTRAIAANSELANQAQNASSLSGNSRAARANSSAIQGQAATQAADIIGKYNNENVGISNTASRENSNITNQLLQAQGARANRLYQGNVIANQQYDNATREGRSDLLNQYSNAWKNRQGYDDLNQTNQYYYRDSNTGMMHFRDDAARLAYGKITSGQYSGSGKTISQMKQAYIDSGGDPDHAAEFADDAYREQQGLRNKSKTVTKSGKNETQTTTYGQQKYGGRTSALKSFVKKRRSNEGR